MSAPISEPRWRPRSTRTPRTSSTWPPPSRPPHSWHAASFYWLHLDRVPDWDAQTSRRRQATTTGAAWPTASTARWARRPVPAAIWRCSPPRPPRKIRVSAPGNITHMYSGTSITQTQVSLTKVLSPNAWQLVSIKNILFKSPYFFGSTMYLM